MHALLKNFDWGVLNHFFYLSIIFERGKSLERKKFITDNMSLIESLKEEVAYLRKEK